ncbi:putative Hexokinase-4, chloroplastic [Cocos nucifera]|uniref:Phosphotransferase n=1 Tax=Cocos nucifera TaxID=13894 RepID=A0A8K0IDS8_COCNU|nr:putative Hexokinase-4, chloroplastic [Cocos nucifera]
MSAAVGSFTAVVPQPATRRRVARAARCSVAGSVAAASPILKNLQLKCATPLPVLRHIANAMATDMRAGLAADGASDLKMILSYVDSLPTGVGKIEALFPSSELFDFIASGLARFVAKEGKDVVACLNEAMKRQGMDMRVSALVNDAVGTLAGARYWDDDVMVAVILGTGTNACYIERMDAIPKLQGLATGSGKTIINTEWGAFSTGLPLTEFDKDMDKESINPGEQKLQF